MKPNAGTLVLALAAVMCGACSHEATETLVKQKLTKYTEVTLTSDLGGLSANERKMIPVLIEACQAMDDIFWKEAYGDKQKLVASIRDPELERFAEINYGPWDRLQNDQPFIDGVGPKPVGAQFYPTDMTKNELDRQAAKHPGLAGKLRSPYTLVRRDKSGGLVIVPYHEAFAPEVKRAAEKLIEAAKLADDPGLKNYLLLRATALLTDDYPPSDLAWMEMKNNRVDVVIGPIERYEDNLIGTKTAHAGYVLVKDPEWSARLTRYVSLLPGLQKTLPVPDVYKQETPGTDADLNAYDVLYYAGDSNAGSKTIAINLPNDEEVQLKKGTRRLQLKNAMRAKFDKILVPIADRMIAADQRAHVTFDAFFGNVMFHEVAHGLGIKRTIEGDKKSVREALQELAGPMEEGKADVLGLFMVTKLKEMGELKTDLLDNYVTFLAGIFRSIRFGGTSAHGLANLAQLEFLRERDAFSRDDATGTYHVNFDKMQVAIAALSEKILVLQGNGDLPGVKEFLPGDGEMDKKLRADLDGLTAANIPTDVVFRQGVDVLQAATSGTKP